MNSFNNQDEIQNQFKMPDNEQAQRHKCEICDKDFKTKETLRVHFNHFHKQKQQQYICDIDLDLHMKVIHENKHTILHIILRYILFSEKCAFLKKKRVANERRKPEATY